jgi:cystathionine gamma-synthase
MNDELAGLHPESLVVAAGRPARDHDAQLNPPISLTSTFHATPPGELDSPRGYARYGNESWSALEGVIGDLEGGKTLLFASGMNAITTVFSLLPHGAVVTTSHNGYTGVQVFLSRMVEEGRLEVRYVDISDTDAVLEALPGTALLWLESPTNPGLDVADLPKLIKAAKALNCGVGVDNTFATPLNQKPLEMGADMVIHSVTKYLSGHSDILMGSISTNDEALYKRLHDLRNIVGGIPGPFEAWLALRGIRTLSLRLERAQANALELAKRLSTHPAVERVRYPGLPTDPAHKRASEFMKGYGAVLSIDVKGGPEAADKACNSSKLVTHATSLGGVESLWERRHRWSWESPSIPKNLVRLSVGIENVEDLWADIDQALQASQR